MANGLFPAFLDAWIAGTMDDDLTDGGLRITLVDAGYTYDAGDDFFDDIDDTAQVATLTLQNVARSGNLLVADDDTFASLSGDEVTQVILWYSTGNEATSRLIARWDSATGLPLTPVGTDLSLQWPDGAVLQFPLTS